MVRIVGLYNWHDGGYCVLENGEVKEHIEIERYNRLKESSGDSLKYFRDIFLKKNNLTLDDVDYWVSPYPDTNLEKSAEGDYDTYSYIEKQKIKFYSHHLCHAAHAFYSSPYDNAYILTLDSAGLVDSDDKSTNKYKSISTGIYTGNGNDIKKIGDVLNDHMSLGSLWGRFTRLVFKLSAGYPRGHQAGSVMAMAALGDPKKYYDDVFKAATVDFGYVKQTPPGYKRGVYVPPEEDVIHPYLHPFRQIAENDEQEKFNIAAALQKVTEDIIMKLISEMIMVSKNNGFNSKNICLAGGVSLNSVAMAKILSTFPELENVYIPPVPYDGGLSIGACQYHWYKVLNNDRNYNFVTPYLGETYSKNDALNAIKKHDLCYKENVSLDECVDLLIDQKIVSVFQGRSESGRRALGNRSILADPRNKNMKDMINQKVKHRQWYRPFAPSILEEFGDDWFEGFYPSPYMSFVFKFKENKFDKTPAVEHFNRTARLQSVNKNQNPKYYELIDNFRKKTGVPIILNTSFNDREPICETPNHAIVCYLNTDIDYLYFPEYEILVLKNENLS